MVSAVLNFLFELVHRVRNLTWRLRHKGPYRVWFLVPRYHTNMIPMVAAFQEAGDTVEMIVSHQEVIEDHARVRPMLVGERLHEVKNSKEKTAPDIVIIRDLSEDMIQLSHWAKINGARTIHYTQKPSRRKKGSSALHKDINTVRGKFRIGLPLSTITPIDNNPNLPRRLFHHVFEFPVMPPSPIPSSERAKPQILMVGKLAQPRKRHFWVIDALRALNVDCTLIICGADLDLNVDDGTRSKSHYDRLMATPGETNQNGKVKIDIRPDVPPADMKALYQSSAVFALPALNEEFGISVLEAMAQGCAIITTNQVGAARHIQSGVNGYVVDANDETQFRSLLKKLVTHPKKRSAMQRAALNSISSHHQPEQFRGFILSRA